MDRDFVRLALALAEGVANSDSDADGLVLDAFDQVDEAAQAHAYLAGFLLELLAAERDETIRSAAEYARRMLDRT